MADEQENKPIVGVPINPDEMEKVHVGLGSSGFPIGTGHMEKIDINSLGKKNRPIIIGHVGLESDEPVAKVLTIIEAREHLKGKTILVCGDNKLDLIRKLKDMEGEKILIASEALENISIPKNPFSQSVYPYVMVPEMDLSRAYYEKDVPDNLQYLIRLNLTEIEKRHLLDTPPQRQENETQEMYKLRRKLNKLLVKYRGEI